MYRRRVANTLQTAGLLDVIDCQYLYNVVNLWHTNARLVPLSDQCLVYIALGIGTLASDIDYSSEEGVVHRRGTDTSEQAEKYYASSEVVAGPVSRFVDGDIWSIQALAMITVYALIFPRWNAAYCFIGKVSNVAYSWHSWLTYYLLGMAVRAAVGLGLHQTLESSLPFTEHDRDLRRRIWRSLYALDRMISLMHGRPVSIPDDAHQSHLLQSIEENKEGRPDRSKLSRHGAQEAILMLSITAGEISTQVYSGDNVSLKTIQDIAQRLVRRADKFSEWIDTARLQNASLRFVEVFSILNTHLYAYFNAIAMTRQFFFRQLNMSIKGFNSDPDSIGLDTSELHDKLPSLQLSKACVDASVSTICLILYSWESGRLSRRTPSLL